VVTTDQDYGRMITTWDQRVRRDGITVTFVDFPVPTTEDDLYTRIERAITPRTKVLHFCHITNLTGQLFPVQRLSRMARARGITTVVDGAHAVAHFPFALRDLECDFYGTSLHKWLLAPVGTGFLYVRRDRIAGCWPLQAAPRARTDDIRKFEEIGTSPAATKAAINEALAFHQAIGTERKAARLRYLTLRWANRLKDHPRIRMHTDLAHVYGVANVGVDGLPAAKVNEFLWDRYRIITTPIQREDYNGIRVTPNIYTPLEEIDTFVEAMNALLQS
jgi:selenocysteine lyase/cysteine desulfurase